MRCCRCRRWARPPTPAVFWVHGGPTWADRDEFGPTAAAFVDHGYAVVRVNYRGSTGYGATWRDAIEADIGLTEQADIAAVRKHLVDSGTLDAARTVLARGSWGGYLTLLGLGTRPEAWAAGVAWVPVADFVAAYEDEAESLRAFDRSLFGGSPAEVPDRYERSSPITYAEKVRVPRFVGARRERSAVPDPPDRELPCSAGRDGAPVRGVPLRCRARLLGRRRAGTPDRQSAGVHPKARAMTARPAGQGVAGRTGAGARSSLGMRIHSRG